MEILAFLGAAWWAIVLAGGIAVLAGMGIYYAMDSQDVGGGCATSIAVMLLIFVVVFGVMAGISAYTTVERGNIGLVTRFGGLTNEVFQPGLNWKTPFIEGVEMVDITQQSYEMSQHPDTSSAQWTDYQVDSKTSDGQGITISGTTIFRIPSDKAVDIRNTIGPVSEVVDNVVKANTRSITRNEAKNWTSDQLYTGDVVEYQDAVRTLLEGKFANEGAGLQLVDFLIRGIAFDPDYEVAVEAKQIAAENVITQRNNAAAAENEAKRQAELAKGKAAERVALAEADAEAVRLNADANAYAIEQEGAALKRFAEVLQLRLIESLNNKTVFIPSDGMQYLLPLTTGVLE